MPGYKNPPKDKGFKPGQSGNPKGKPPDAKKLVQIMRATVGEAGFEELITRIQKNAKTKGAVGQRAAEYLVNQLAGMPKQTNVHEDGDGNPIKWPSAIQVIMEGQAPKPHE